MIHFRSVALSSRFATKTVGSIRNGSSKNVKIQNPSAAWLPFPPEVKENKPVRVKLEAGKKYKYCTCGLTTKSPWCDGRDEVDGFSMLRPIEFTVDKTDDYVLCQCKLSKQRPICDGSHKSISAAEIKPHPRDSTDHFAVHEDTEVYDGTAHDLGFRMKNGFQGFQK